LIHKVIGTETASSESSWNNAANDHLAMQPFLYKSYSIDLFYSVVFINMKIIRI
jgi:hypothetical protein